MQPKPTSSAQPTFPMPQPVPRPRRARVRSSWLLIGGLMTLSAAVVMMIVAVVGALALYGGSSEPRVASGVTVAGLALGGQTVEQATGALSAHSVSAQPVILVDQDRRWTRTLGELGISLNVPMTMQRVENAPAGAQVQPVYAIDLTQTQDALIALSAEVNIAAVPGNPPQMGRALDIPVVLNRLRLNLDGELADGQLELDIIVTEPPAAEVSANSTGQTTIHVVEPGQELALIARQYGVDMADIVALNDLANPDLLWVGQELIIPAAGEYMPSAAEAPAAPTPVGKSIVVSTDAQRIYAYENGQLIRSHLASTGLPATPTVKGDYAIYVKYAATDMSGPDYYLPQVPYTMYFYQGYGIHGTYWHNSFGRPMSHGCVNLPTEEAKWFFEWAEVGTPVRVI